MIVFNKYSLPFICFTLNHLYACRRRVGLLFHIANIYIISNVAKKNCFFRNV